MSLGRRAGLRSLGLQQVAIARREGGRPTVYWPLSQNGAFPTLRSILSHRTANLAQAMGKQSALSFHHNRSEGISTNGMVLLLYLNQRAAGYKDDGRRCPMEPHTIRGIDLVKTVLSSGCAQLAREVVVTSRSLSRKQLLLLHFTGEPACSN